MTCCDLEPILKQLKRIIKVLAPEEFEKKETVIPARWLYPTTNDNDVTIQNYASYNAAIMRMIDRVFGGVPGVVSIKDVDPTKEGDQGVTITMHSLMDALSIVGRASNKTTGCGGCDPYAAVYVKEAG